MNAENPDPSGANGDLVKVAVDPETCIGAGQCEMNDPDVFVIDEDDVVASVVEPGMLSRDRAQDAVDRCPAGAISIVEE